MLKIRLQDAENSCLNRDENENIVINAKLQQLTKFAAADGQRFWHLFNF